MTRFNYLNPSRRPSFAFQFGVLAIDDRIRGPLATLLATLIVTATLSSIQLARLRSAHSMYAQAARILAADQPAVEQVEALRSRVGRKTRLDVALTDMRRANFTRSNELTWIGNRLPSQTWLSGLRYENGGYVLEGSSARAADVGAAMFALHDPVHATVPQFVSMHNDGTPQARVSYSLRVQTAP